MKLFFIFFFLIKLRSLELQLNILDSKSEPWLYKFPTTFVVSSTVNITTFLNYDTLNNISYLTFKKATSELTCFNSDPYKSYSILSQFNLTIKGCLAKSDISVSKNTTMTSSFLITQNSNLGLQNLEGVADFGVLSSKGIINTIIQNKSLPNNIIQRIYKNNSGVLFLGNIPNDVSARRAILNLYYNTSQIWEIKLSKFIFSDQIKINSKDGGVIVDTDRVLISTFDSYIYAPNEYNYSLIDVDSCNPSDSGNGYITFICLKNSLFQKKNIFFIFDEFGLPFLNSDLFTDFNSTHAYFNIRFFKDKSDFWIIGNIFLKNFDVLFDRTNKKVHFFSDAIIDFRSPIMIYILVSFAILVASTIFLVGIFSFFCRKINKILKKD